MNELHSFLEQLQIVAIIEQLDVIPNLIPPPFSILSLCRSSGSDGLIVFHDALHLSLCIRETLLVSFRIDGYLTLRLN